MLEESRRLGRRTRSSRVSRKANGDSGLLDVNHRGQIAIDTVDAQLVHHGFLFDRGRFTEIKPRGAAGNGSPGTDVDDPGRVLGYIL